MLGRLGFTDTRGTKEQEITDRAFARLDIGVRSAQSIAKLTYRFLLVNKPLVDGIFQMHKPVGFRVVFLLPAEERTFLAFVISVALVGWNELPVHGIDLDHITRFDCSGQHGRRDNILNLVLDRPPHGPAPERRIETFIGKATQKFGRYRQFHILFTQTIPDILKHQFGHLLHFIFIERTVQNHRVETIDEFRSENVLT